MTGPVFEVLTASGDLRCHARDIEQILPAVEISECICKSRKMK